MASAAARRWVDFNSSLFWSFAGVASVVCAATAVHQRVRVQERRLELCRRRNAVTAELAEAQAEAAAARGAVAAAEAELEAARGWRWAPVGERLAALLAAAPGGPLAQRSGGSASGSTSSSSDSTGGGRRGTEK